jgi:hypothetical protein
MSPVLASPTPDMKVTVRLLGPISRTTTTVRQDIWPFFRHADFCLVHWLDDGMNLVAKEFVSAREDDDGVLIPEPLHRCGARAVGSVAREPPLRLRRNGRRHPRRARDAAGGARAPDEPDEESSAGAQQVGWSAARTERRHFMLDKFRKLPEGLQGLVVAGVLGLGALVVVLVIKSIV